MGRPEDKLFHGVVARGRSVEVMPAEWKLDGDGLALFVERLPAVLR
jgi:hypothetical protein